jgi:hypothetical protein
MSRVPYSCELADHEKKMMLSEVKVPVLVSSLSHPFQF